MKPLVAVLAGAVLAGLAAPVPALAGDPIMPLAAVAPGMQCEGRSVIKGTAVSSFDVEIVDVIRDGPSYRDRILLRVSGPAVDETGLGPGFSGSPIYCPGPSGPANAGAISEGVGDYGNKLALATPIEEILREPAEAPAPIAAGRRLSSPLTVSRLSAPFARILRRAARAAGRELVVAPAGAKPGYPPQELVPGSAAAVGVATGDFSMGGVGTVAYRDGTRIWVFGHPFDGLGPRGLFLQDATVHTVVNNPLGFDLTTYKLAAPGNVLGSIYNDGLSAVAGQVGPLPQAVRLTITTRDADSGVATVEETQIAEESSIGLPGNASFIVPFAVGDAGVATLRGVGGDMSGRMCLSLSLRERAEPLRLCNRYFGDRTFPGAVQGEMALDSEFATFLVDELMARRPFQLESVDVDLTLSRGARLLELESARGPALVRPGQRIRVRAKARAPRASPRSVSFRVRVPRTLRPGPYRLVLTGGATASSLEELFSIEEEIPLHQIFARLLSPRARASSHEDDDDPITTVAQLEKRLAQLRRFPGIEARFRRVEGGPEAKATARKGPQRVYRSPEFGLSGKTEYRLLVVGRRAAGGKRR